MARGAKNRTVAVGLIFSFLIFYFPAISGAESNETGSLVGFVFEQDGTSSLEGAVVQVKNISNDLLYESSPSDSYGVFKIEGLEKGIYVMGVSISQGNFNSDKLVGIHANSTAKISITLNPYDEKSAQAAEEVAKDQKIKGESLVGRVIGFDQANLNATVDMIKGFLQLDDRIHVKGEVTDFYQDVKDLNFEGKPVKRVFAGQTIVLKMKYNCEINDLVYLVCKRGIIPLWLVPLGLAAIVGGAGIVTLIDNPPTTSQFEK